MKKLAGFLALALIATSAQSAVLISDFDTINPLRISDPSWTGTVVGNLGYQTINGTGTVHSDIFTTPIDFTGNNQDIGWTGGMLFLYWNQGAQNPGAIWDLSLHDTSGTTGSLSFSAAAPMAWMVYYSPGGLDWTEIDQISITGTGVATFNTLSLETLAVPEPKSYSIAAGCVLIGFGIWRKIR